MPQQLLQMMVFRTELHPMEALYIFFAQLMEILNLLLHGTKEVTLMVIFWTGGKIS